MLESDYFSWTYDTSESITTEYAINIFISEKADLRCGDSHHCCDRGGGNCNRSVCQFQIINCT